MYQFAIDLGEEKGYSFGSASGCGFSKKLFENLAVSIQPKHRKLFATLCLLGLGLGLGLGHAWVILGRRLGDPCVTPGSRLGRIVEVPVFAIKVEKGRVGD